MDFPKIEQKILKFWDKNKIFEKSLKKKSPQGDFVFYDGPPFATGSPHYGHIVASLMKDTVPRYWTMKGYHVDRKWGWDCHGLPIENIVEKQMNLNSRKDIEKIGVDKFNETCRSKVLIYAEEWRKVINRFGRWADMDNDYKTMDRDFMESIWWVFKQLWDKGLIYKGYKSMHICPRCETTLSQSEVSEGYQDVEDISVITKFELQDQPGTFILAWTTTPWTLLGNTALAMGKDVEYVLAESRGENFILAEQNIVSLFNSREYKIVKQIKAKDLENKKYKPLFDYYLDKDLKNKKNLYTIQLADFVTVEDGTGVVHIAPGFGEDDLNLGRAKNLSFIQHVGMDGRFTKEIADFPHEEVKPKHDRQVTDKKIINYLKNKDLVFKVEPFTHSYPHCWRCESPLLNYATSSWFVKVTTIKKQILKNAENINWVPAHIKQGRFGKWLEGARDWSISRQRFWGSVMPIWICNKCGEKKVFGSVKELESVSDQKIKDLHKHYVDKIIFKCEKCKGLMKRISDVLDCWFESGSMPYAQMHYPFEHKEKFENNFPAQFIAEGVDQTRAWFYYLHVLSTALKGSEAFKNVIANGIVLTEQGKKMSKRLRNYPDPMEVMDKHGADAVRYYLASSPVMKAEDLNFSEKDLKEQSRFLFTLLNVLAFYQIFSQDIKVGDLEKKSSTNVLDKWIMSKLNLLTKNMTNKMDSYDLNAVREISTFINDLSTWYVRRSRHRFRSENKKEQIKALKTLRQVLLRLSLLMAPFMPFMAEHLYQELKGRKESVHLEDWPEFDSRLIDQKLLSDMTTVRKICEIGHSLRAQAQIRVRQPLTQLSVVSCQLPQDLTDLIKDELNVEQVIIVKDLPKGDDWKISEEFDIKACLNIRITPELKQQGLVRELTRHINALRKKAKLTKNDYVNVYYKTKSKELEKVLAKYQERLKKQTVSKSILNKLPAKTLAKVQVMVDGKEIILALGE